MSEDNGNAAEQQALQKEQLENVRLENEKLRLEIQKQQGVFDQVSRIIPMISTLIGVAGFWFGVNQYQTQQTENRKAQVAQADQEQKTAQQARMKPWLESQREIYTQALSEASIATNTKDPGKRNQAIENFFSLYYGKMNLVETIPVSGAMKSLGSCLDGTKVCSKGDLDKRVLALGTALKESMAATASKTYEEFAKDQFNYGN